MTEEESHAVWFTIVKAMALIYELPDSCENADVYERLQEAKETMRKFMEEFR